MRRIIPLLFILFLENFALGYQVPIPVLIKPDNNSVIEETSPKFDWYLIEKNAYKYLITIYEDDNSSKRKIVLRTDVLRPPWNIPAGYLENGKTYYWRVVAEKGNTYSSPSEVWSFTINEEKESQSSGTNEKICPNCQKEIEPGSKYCGYCGSKLTGVVKKSNSVEQIKTEYKESYQSRPEPEPVKEIPYTSKSKTIKDITWIEGGLLVLAILLCL